MSQLPATAADGSHDYLTSLSILWEGDELINVMTGEIVTRYSGVVHYLVLAWGGPRESQLKIDISRAVGDLIDGNMLTPGPWFLLHNKQNRIGADESLLSTY